MISDNSIQAPLTLTGPVTNVAEERSTRVNLWKPVLSMARKEFGDRFRSEVKGRIIEIDAAEKSVRIAHEEIPDYMPAMTMPFSVKSTALLTQVLICEQSRWSRG
jgi:hypothetical protein